MQQLPAQSKARGPFKHPLETSSSRLPAQMTWIAAPRLRSKPGQSVATPVHASSPPLGLQGTLEVRSWLSGLCTAESAVSGNSRCQRHVWGQNAEQGSDVTAPCCERGAGCIMAVQSQLSLSVLLKHLEALLQPMTAAFNDRGSSASHQRSNWKT